MNKHQWVMFQYTPVEVDQRPDGALDISATEAAIEISTDEGLIGCWHCNIPLTSESFNTECVSSKIIDALP